MENQINMQQLISFHNTPIAKGFIFENSNDNAPELNLNRINILVGANNAGKSRLMREIIKLNNYTFVGLNYKSNLLKVIERLEELIEIFKQNTIIVEGKFNGNSTRLHDDFFNNELLEPLKNILIFSELKSNISLLKRKYFIFNNIFSIEGSTNWKFTSITINSQIVNLYHRNFLTISSFETYRNIKKNIELITSEIYDILHKYLLDTLLDKSFHKTYIPTLRSAVTFINESKEVFETNTDPKNKDLFHSSVKYNYELEDVKDLDIFTGRDLYGTISKSKRGYEETRRQFEKFEEFIGNTFFGQKIEITSIEGDTSKDRHITVTFKGEQERELHNYGDGIQTLMLLTYKLFMAKQGEWIFIEEPELNLHPALQREFLRLITEDEYIRAKELRIFFTTHSNHLLDLTITGNEDISIFVFEREQKVKDVKSKSKIREVSHTDLKILHELGVHNSSVFLANCSIWVEGITDRMYIKAYLQAYQQHLIENPKEDPKMNWKEDRHYSFFEYAGSNIMHYNFDDTENNELINANFLANNVMLVADADMGKEPKHERFKQQLGEHYVMLKVREIENLLSAKQLKSALPKLYTTTNDINSDKFEVVEFDEKAYQKIDEKYLRNHIVETLQKYSLQVPKGLKLELDKDNKLVCKTFSSDHKEKLATAVVNDIKQGRIQWKDLSTKAQKFTIKIYDFIREKNKGVIN